MVSDPLGTIRLPLNEMADWGVNTTLNVTLWLGPTMTGRVGPVIENPVAANSVCAITTPRVPVLVSTTGKVELDPTATEPNPREEALDFTDSLVTPTPPMRRMIV